MEEAEATEKSEDAPAPEMEETATTEKPDDAPAPEMEETATTETPEDAPAPEIEEDATIEKPEDDPAPEMEETGTIETPEDAPAPEMIEAAATEKPDDAPAPEMEAATTETPEDPPAPEMIEAAATEKPDDAPAPEMEAATTETPEDAPAPDLAYTIENSEELGRYMVAARDLQVGDIIFEEYPLCAGPQLDSALLCPGCYKNAESNCIKCGWPLCAADADAELNGNHRHDKTECNLLSSYSGNEDPDWVQISDALMLFRCLALKKTAPAKWAALQEMESHLEKWKGSSFFPMVNALEKTLREYYLTPSDSEEDFSTAEIQSTQAVINVNAFEVRMPAVNIQAIYQLCCILEHSCLPNTHRTTSSETLLLTLKAATVIPKGTHLSTSYCDILWSTKQRREFLQSSKFFTCKCKRCLDPTECGSFLSGFLCPTCPKMTPVVPRLDSEGGHGGKFYCWDCKEEWDFVESGLEAIVKEAEQELLLLDENPSEKCQEYLAWIMRWSLFPTEEIRERLKIGHRAAHAEEIDAKRPRIEFEPSASTPKLLLHPQHSLVLDACHTLFLITSYEESVPSEQLGDKLLLGLHLIQATSNITQQISKFQGTAMCELALTSFAVILRQFGDDEPDEDDSNVFDESDTAVLTFYIKNSFGLLKAALEHLKHEPADQPEGAFYATGLRQLTRLRELFATIGYMDGDDDTAQT